MAERGGGRGHPHASGTPLAAGVAKTGPFAIIEDITGGEPCLGKRRTMELTSDITALSALLYIAIGFAVAVFGTLIGAGGGIIFVPLFLWMFDWPPTAIAGTSLAIVLFNAISASLAFNKQKKIKYDAAIPFAAATIPGAILGALWSGWFTGSSFRTAFGVLLLFISLVIVWKNTRKSAAKYDLTADPKDIRVNMPLGLAISFGIGFISSTFGIGGGVIQVPAMVGFLGFPPHIATATSQFVLAISSLIGVVSHQWEAHILWDYAILFGIGAIFGAQEGAKISKKIKGRSILFLLAGALMLVALRLIILG